MFPTLLLLLFRLSDVFAIHCFAIFLFVDGLNEKRDDGFDNLGALDVMLSISFDFVIYFVCSEGSHTSILLIFSFLFFSWGLDATLEELTDLLSFT